ncbi:unnamed protein product [Ectocarpus sp. 4 AP-2014]
MLFCYFAESRRGAFCSKSGRERRLPKRIACAMLHASHVVVLQDNALVGITNDIVERWSSVLHCCICLYCLLSRFIGNEVVKGIISTFNFRESLAGRVCSGVRTYDMFLSGHQEVL